MKRRRAGQLAVRAVNQYRRRDVLTYLGLRFYLDNLAARSDRWADEVSTRLVRDRTVSPYFRALHFKQVDIDGEIEHRRLFLPGPNEALAEASLLEECAACDWLQNPPCVFSYQLAKGNSRVGVFEPYFDGLSARQDAIAEACEQGRDRVVLYVDIRRFYPSIERECAQATWLNLTETAGLGAAARDLGLAILLHHAAVGAARGDGEAVLTGPMFSHLMGNLVLRGLDDACQSMSKVAYSRYVDDIVLVGQEQAVKSALSEVNSRLGDLGLELHDEHSSKTLLVPAAVWLEGRDDFARRSRAPSWPSMIGNLKRLLIVQPHRRDEIARACEAEGFRLPIRDYEAAVAESSYFTRLVELSLLPWLKFKIRRLTVADVVSEGRLLRQRFLERLRSLIDEASSSSSYRRKRLVPKLRFYSGRLVYLASDADLLDLSAGLRGIPELEFHSRVMRAVATGEVEGVLELGVNAAQAAAQALRQTRHECVLPKEQLSEVETQGLAVMLLNGVRMRHSALEAPAAAGLVRFAAYGADLGMMKSEDSYLREVACLHGLSPSPRHAGMLDTAFDIDEELPLDAIDQLQGSVSA